MLPPKTQLMITNFVFFVNEYLNINIVYSKKNRMSNQNQFLASFIEK